MNEAATRSELELLIEGLRGPHKRISSKYHYDERGSQLFEQITELDEYYPTRTERALLEHWMPIWVSDLQPATLVELGAGSAEKSRVALDAMVEAGCGRAYVPIDVSADFLAGTAEALRTEYPGLRIVPLVADIAEPLNLPARLAGPRWVAFLGSTLGNFEGPEAVALLSRIAAGMRPEDHFLLGIDLRPGASKTAERIELAYNDAQGVTAAFSLNILNVINTEFAADFDPSGFRHRAVYNRDAGRIETFLDSIRDQVVHFSNREEIRIAQGEAVRSEVSCKYDRSTIEELFHDAGLCVERWGEDSEGYYALVLAAKVDRASAE
jgi:L-histidine Nalpha-methyltransferase